MTRISVGLDLSLSASGVAFIRDGEDRPELHVCTVPGLPANATVEQELVRMRNMATKVVSLVTRARQLNDKLSFNFEGPAMGMTGGKTDERAGLRWILTLNLALQGPVMFTPPTSAKKYWTGNGGADKHMMMTFAALRYPGQALLDNNAVDALALAHIGATHFGFNLIPNIPACDVSAIEKLNWPITESDSSDD